MDLNGSRKVVAFSYVFIVLTSIQKSRIALGMFGDVEGIFCSLTYRTLTLGWHGSNPASPPEHPWAIAGHL